MYRQPHFDLGSGLTILLAVAVALLVLWALLHLPLGGPALTVTI